MVNLKQKVACSATQSGFLARSFVRRNSGRRAVSLTALSPAHSVDLIQLKRKIELTRGLPGAKDHTSGATTPVPDAGKSRGRDF